METLKGLRNWDLLFYVDEDGDALGVAQIVEVDENEEKAYVNCPWGKDIKVGPESLAPIPANRENIWIQNNFRPFAGDRCYIEDFGPNVSPYPLPEKGYAMVVLMEERVYFLINDKYNPSINNERRRLEPYTYLHEIQHEYWDLGYIKEWAYEK